MAAFIVDMVFDMLPIDVAGLPFVGDIFDTFKLVMMLILILIAIFYFLIAMGMFQGKNWARRMGIIFAIIGLFNLPVGTIISIIILIYLYKADVKAYFGK